MKQKSWTNYENYSLRRRGRILPLQKEQAELKEFFQTAEKVIQDANNS